MSKYTVEFSVTEFRVNTEGGYVEYLILVDEGFRSSKEVWKRYSHIFELDRILRKTFIEMNSIPFPTKFFFQTTNTNTDKLEERMKDLQIYLTRLTFIRVIFKKSTVLRHFFSLHPFCSHIARSTSVDSENSKSR